MVGNADILEQFNENVTHYKKIDFNMNILQQTACMVFVLFYYPDCLKH